MMGARRATDALRRRRLYRTRRIAPLRRRAAAGAISGLAFVPVVAVGGFLAGPLASRFPAAARWVTGVEGDSVLSIGPSAVQRPRLSWSRRAGWTVLSLATSLVTRNWRSPGQR